MSFIDDMKRTVASAAGTALEKGQQAADVVRLQTQLKKLQLERARRLHELGARSYDWFKSGGMVVSGPVPADVVDICHQLEGVHAQIDDTQRQLDETGRADPAAPAVTAPAAAPPAPPVAGATAPIVTPAPGHDTAPLPDPASVPIGPSDP